MAAQHNSVRTARILLFYVATGGRIKRESRSSILEVAVLSGETAVLEMLLNYYFTFEEM